MSARRGWWRAVAGAAARGGLLAAHGCVGASPAVVALSASIVPERVATTLTLTTRGCAPAFDLDRGTLLEEVGGVAVLAPGARAVAARRAAPEEFAVALPDDLLPGVYDLVLRLDDGRAAPYQGHLEVTRAEAVIEDVGSPRSTVGVGEGGVPLAVTVYNPSLCALDEVTVTPVFRRGGADYSGVFAVAPARARLAPGARTRVAFTVDVGGAATPGAVALDARAAAPARDGGAGCGGPVALASAQDVGQWYLVAPARQTLEVTAVDVRPEAPRVGSEFRLGVTLTNRGSASVDVQTFSVRSVPAAVSLAGTPNIAPSRLDPGAARLYVLAVRADAAARPDVEYALWVEATATDVGGQTYTTRPSNAPTPLVLRAR